MELFTVDEKLCNKDGICAMVCPVAVIQPPAGDKVPAPAANAEEACIRCGHCVAVCPTGALSHRDMPVETCPPIKKELSVSPEGIEQLVRSRRSIRVFRQGALDRADIERLINIARYAPSGHNTQPVRWLAVSEPEKVKEIASHVVGWCRALLETQPALAKSLHMDLVTMAWDFGYDAILRGAPALIAAIGETGNMMAPNACVIALTTMELAAPSLGLGTCWAGYFSNAARNWPPLQKALNLPPGHELHGAVMVGRPKFKYQRMPARNEPVIHWR